jgi:hypothetical protein
MKISERSSMWHHAVFSMLLCTILICIIAVRRDGAGLVVAAVIGLYVAGNTYLHYRRQDFSKETLYEYILVSVAVLVVLLGAITH